MHRFVAAECDAKRDVKPSSQHSGRDTVRKSKMGIDPFEAVFSAKPS